MTTFILCALVAAFVLVAVEELIFPLKKFRGLLAIVVSGLSVYSMGIADIQIIVYTLASAFAGLVMALVVESTLTKPDDMSRIMRELPRRVPPL